MFAQGTKLISQTLISSSIITYTMRLTEEITDMFVQGTNLLFPLCTCQNKHAHHLSR